jgi:enterochelin esterase-like enzyme
MTWRWPDTAFGAMNVVVRVPPRPRGDERFPVLVAFHGQGEALKGPERGARGWLDDYGLARALEALHTPPLAADDYKGFVAGKRLHAVNAALAATPFRDLIIVCPYTPAPLGRRDRFDVMEPIADFIVHELLPRVHRALPSLGPSATGVDGVSLGGRVALLVGLLRPTAFRAVAGLQPAFDTAEARDFAALAGRALRENSQLTLRLLTSDGDYYRPSTHALSRALTERGIDHAFLVAAGPHNYAFNQGPGVLEMLLFHDRSLRGEAAP